MQGEFATGAKREAGSIPRVGGWGRVELGGDPRSAGSRLITAPADGAESDAGRSRARLTAAELTKEVTADDLEGLRAQALDEAALAGESSGMRLGGR